MGSQSGAVIALEDVQFDSVSREVRREGAVVRLSPKAAAVLSMLAEAQGQVCARDDLLDRLWRSSAVGEEVLTHAICEIRRALGDTPRKPRYVETVHKLGYRLKTSASALRRRDVETFDLEAYAECLHAEAVGASGRRRDVERAIEIYTGIVERSPGFARARAGLARALLVSVAMFDGGDATLRAAAEHCAAALNLDPACAEAIAVQGVLPLFWGDFAKAERLFARALSLAPHSFDIHDLIGRSCYAMGRYELAATLLDRAASLRPLDCRAPLLAGTARLRAGDVAGARRAFMHALLLAERRLEAQPDDSEALQTRADCMWRLDHGRGTACSCSRAERPTRSRVDGGRTRG